MSRKALIQASVGLVVVAGIALCSGGGPPTAVASVGELVTTWEAFYNETTLKGFLKVLDRKMGITTALGGLHEYDQRGDRVLALCVLPYDGPRTEERTALAFIERALAFYPDTEEGRVEGLKAICNMIRVSPPLRLPGLSDVMGRENYTVYNDFKGTLLLSTASGSPRVFREEWLPKRGWILKGDADQDQP